MTEERPRRGALEIAPSILDSDLANLADTLRAMEREHIRYVHLDVMDGHFVPNISIGIPVVKSARKHTDLILDVHLMIERPEQFIPSFVEAGADILTVHPESTPHIHRALQMIHDTGARPGLALNPGTPLMYALELLDELALVLIMSVNPGFGGQQFIPSALERIRKIRSAIDEHHLNVIVEVDGGVNANTVHSIYQAGADIVVAGTAIFSNPNGVEAAIRELRLSVTD